MGQNLHRQDAVGRRDQDLRPRPDKAAQQQPVHPEPRLLPGAPQVAQRRLGCVALARQILFWVLLKRLHHIGCTTTTTDDQSQYKCTTYASDSPTSVLDL